MRRLGRIMLIYRGTEHPLPHRRLYNNRIAWQAAFGNAAVKKSSHIK
jgi:hypothetical protein